MIFWTWWGRWGFLLSSSRIKNVIIKLSKGFPKKINFGISYFISFFKYLLGKLFLSSWMIFLKASSSWQSSQSQISHHGESLRNQQVTSNPTTLVCALGIHAFQPKHPKQLGAPIPQPSKASWQPLAPMDIGLPQQLLEPHRGRDGTYLRA